MDEDDEAWPCSEEQQVGRGGRAVLSLGGGGSGNDVARKESPVGLTLRSIGVN